MPQHGVSIVCDYRLSSSSLDHLVHTAGSEGGSNGIGDGSGSLDISSAHCLRLLLVLRFVSISVGGVNRGARTLKAALVEL